jgi:hypothetical protein
MISWDRVNELRREVGDEDFAEVVTIFLDEVETVLARMDSASDPDRFPEDLHFLKGSALNLGFRALGALCDGSGAGAQARRDSHIADIRRIYGLSKAEFLAQAGV